jgi:hypothetical protein
MSWSNFYLLCFLVGFALSTASFLAGAIHLHLPFKVHVPWHFGGHHGAVSHGGGGHISWFNASSVLAFLAWFGGVGYLLTQYSGIAAISVVVVATLAGLAAGYTVLRFIIKLTGAQDLPLLEGDRRVEGAVGVVSMTIREKGTGEIIYPVAGVRRCSGARTEDGRAIEKGAEVVIERYDRGIAYVRRWEEFVGQ